VQVPAPAPQTMGWLFGVCSDVAELLAVVALHESALGSICFHPDSNEAEAWQLEDFLGLCVLGKVMRKRGRFIVWVPRKGTDGWLSSA
jgi:hypothetical protein